MSRYFSANHAQLKAFVPGEQPAGIRCKLNTNESPFPPSPAVAKAVADTIGRLQLYCDPACAQLTAAVAELCGVEPEQVLMTNGSDEALSLAFLAYGDAEHPLAMPDVSYGFYGVGADLYNIPKVKLPLREDWTIDVQDYCGIGKNVVLANPNAPTGLLLPVDQLEEIVRTNPDHMIIVDEAYADFCNAPSSCLPLLKKYDNLLITRTFSKGYSMSGARLGFVIARPEVIEDLKTVKNSINPYNVNSMTAAAGLAALSENDYYMENCRIIRENRDRTKDALRAMGAEVLDSSCNFLFFRCPGLTGEAVYAGLRRRGVLIRYFAGERTSPWARVTVGTQEQMEDFLNALRELLAEQ